MKRIIIIIMFFLSATSMFGQFTYGPRVGVGAASIQEADMGVSFHIGAFLNAEFYDRFGLQPEVLYTMKTGSSEEDNETGGKDEVKYNHSSIDIPILVFFPLSQHLRVMVGPMLSDISSATREVKGEKDNSYTIEGKAGFAVGIETDGYSPLRVGMRYRNAEASSIEVTVSYTLDW
ncbi:MAG: outer membrane beta-barrel protein [Salinivirgaceae bacterium]